MAAKTRKRRAGLLETTAFIAAFPLNLARGAPPTIVSIADFDQWGENQGFLSAGVENATRNKERNLLRKKINRMACNQTWRLKGKSPFHIIVNSHGVNYAVEYAENAAIIKAHKLPKQARGLVTCKHDALNELVDIAKTQVALPVDLRLRIDLIGPQIDDFEESTALNSAQLDRKLAAIKRDVERIMAAPKRLATP